MGHALQDFESFDVEFEAGGRTHIGANFAGHAEAGFKREILQRFEEFFRHRGFGDNALDGAGAVAKDGEEQLARGAQVVQPALQGNGLAFVGGECGDSGDGSGED
jgi:hypothetical protein